MSTELGQITDRGGRLPVIDRAGEPGTADLDGPLITDVAGLRESWHRIQAEFVDDPREAVADAAALVDHATQTLVGTLRYRQQRLRAMWDSAAAPAAGGMSTPAATFTPNDAGGPGTTSATTAAAPQATFVPNGTATADSALVSDSTQAADEATAADEPPGSEATRADGTLAETPDTASATDADLTADGTRVADSGREPASDGLRGGYRDSGYQNAAYQNAADQDSGYRDSGYRDSGYRNGAYRNGGSQAGGVSAGAGEGARAGQAMAGAADTEQLRVLMKRYRLLLDQICPTQ